MSVLRVQQASPGVRERLHAFEVKALEWDTDFFGARMGTLSRTQTMNGDAASLRADLRRALVAAQDEGFRHLIFRAPVDDVQSIWAAEGAGMRLVDVGIDSTFSFDRTPTPSPPADVAIRAARPEDVAELSELAAEAFTLSRFSADPYFSDEQVRDFHRTWTRNLCAGLAQSVLVAEIHGAIAGFVSCSVSESRGRIPLIGVAGRFRGRRVGQALVSQALTWFRHAGCHIVQVKTQAHNYPALALYHRAGFVVTHSELTFSVTLSSAPQSPREDRS